MAARYGHGEIVKMLLERSDLTPDTPGVRCRTPLLWAVRYGHVEVVKMLLERNNVNPDTADVEGRTLFSWARGSGFKRIAEMLSQRRDVNPGTADKSSSTPLSWAVAKKRKGIMDMLLGRKDANPGIADRSRQSPHDLMGKSSHRGELPEPLTGESAELPGPLLKKIRRISYPPVVENHRRSLHTGEPFVCTPSYSVSHSLLVSFVRIINEKRRILRAIGWEGVEASSSTCSKGERSPKKAKGLYC